MADEEGNLGKGQEVPLHQTKQTKQPEIPDNGKQIVSVNNLELEQGREASRQGGSHWAAVHEKKAADQAQCWLEVVV